MVHCGYKPENKQTNDGDCKHELNHQNGVDLYTQTNGYAVNSGLTLRRIVAGLAQR